MVKTSHFDKNGVKKGAWSEEEDNKLRAYIQRYGHWNWSLLPKFAGLSRSGKSCRLRWVNYLRPDIKHGNFTKEEDDMIVHLHAMLGNKWSAIATKLSGRSDNEIKNRWHTHLKKQAHQTVLGTDHHGTAMQSADQANKKKSPELPLQNEGEINLPSCSKLTDLSDSGVSSNVVSQTSDYQLLEDFWTQPFLEDILSPLNVVDDLIGQPSCMDTMMNDEFCWSMLDSNDDNNSEFITGWDYI